MTIALDVHKSAFGEEVRRVESAWRGSSDSDRFLEVRGGTFSSGGVLERLLSEPTDRGARSETQRV